MNARVSKSQPNLWCASCDKRVFPTRGVGGVTLGHAAGGNLPFRVFTCVPCTARGVRLAKTPQGVKALTKIAKTANKRIASDPKRYGAAPLADDIAIWHLSDALWFDEHSERRFRARAPFPGEVAQAKPDPYWRIAGTTTAEMGQDVGQSDRHVIVIVARGAKDQQKTRLIYSLRDGETLTLMDSEARLRKVFAEAFRDVEVSHAMASPATRIAQ